MYPTSASGRSRPHNAVWAIHLSGLGLPRRHTPCAKYNAIAMAGASLNLAAHRQGSPSAALLALASFRRSSQLKTELGTASTSISNKNSLVPAHSSCSNSSPVYSFYSSSLTTLRSARNQQEGIQGSDEESRPIARMAIFKKKNKSKKVAEEQSAVEPTPKPPPFRPRHTREHSSVSTSSQAQSNYVDAYMARGSVYGYRKDDAAFHPNTPMARAAIETGSTPTNSSYFSSTPSAPSFDSPILGNLKMQVAARDRGYINPHSSGDSGYNSAGGSLRMPSQAASEIAHKPSLNRIPRNDSGLLPTLNFGDGVGKPLSCSDGTYDEAAAELLPATRIPESVLKSARTDATSSEDLIDSRSVLSARSTSKQTRFEEISRMPKEQPQDGGQVSDRQSNQQLLVSKPADESSPSVEAPLGPQSFNPSQFQSGQSSSHSPAPASLSNEPEEIRSHNDTSGRSLGWRISSLGEQRISSTQPSHAQDTVPHLSILEGFKVNKKGKILNEEGDQIGDLVEGDIVDCVRQKANAVGEVLDEYGSYVGSKIIFIDELTTPL